ncbi:hypothetical protein [Streptococcus sp. A12]|jgi:hypothetical protein|uniref:hypothetical protein n=1 Tax=Streptococcus sp. A12 TaxID=1759399 RepID=UPI0025E41EF7|nr:hypothetical protein [Streptococcus sp. A12]
MESRDVEWETLRKKERELHYLEEQYYQEKKKLETKALDIEERNRNLEILLEQEFDKMNLTLRRFVASENDIRDYFIDMEDFRQESFSVYKRNILKIEEEKEKLDKDFRKKKNQLEEGFNSLRR